MEVTVVGIEIEVIELFRNAFALIEVIVEGSVTLFRWRELANAPLAMETMVTLPLSALKSLRSRLDMFMAGGNRSSVVL